jgi:hypothetical protein
MVRMSPYLDDFTADHGPLLPGPRIEANGQAYQNDRDHGGPYHVTAAFSERFAARRVVDFLPGFLMK